MSYVVETGSVARGMGLGLLSCAALFAWLSVEFPASTDRATEFQAADTQLEIEENLVSETIESSTFAAEDFTQTAPVVEVSPQPVQDSTAALVELTEIASFEGGAEDLSVSLGQAADPDPAQRDAVVPEVAAEVPSNQPQVSSESAAVPQVTDITQNSPSVSPASADVTIPVSEASDSLDQQEIVVVEGGQTQIEGQAAVETESVAQVPLPEIKEGRAYIVNAIPFTDDPRLPLVSLVIQDDGDGRLNVNDLVALGIPLNVSVPVARSDATEMATLVSELGFEVVAELAADALVRVPASGSGASDVEAVMLSVPNAVAVYDSGAIEGSARSDVISSVAAYMGQSGHALISAPSRGSRSLLSSADAAGLPFQQANRVVDEIPDKARVIRAMEFAKVRARSGPIVLISSDAPATLGFIAEWLKSPAAALVQFGPFSAVMARQF